MATRRGVLAGLAASLVPVPTWADAGAPDYLAAAKTEAGFALYGLAADGREIFSLPLPDRGHAAAAHPTRPEAVAFARRPGTFAVVIDCRDGAIKARLTAAESRHFCGHGAFSADGSLLFTTENDWDANRGMIGIRDTRSGYAQIGEVPSGGIGPHEMLRLPGGGFAVANGGLSSHPDAGDSDFGIPEMVSNLAYLGPDGALTEVVSLSPDLRRNSIRHLAVRADGLVGFAMQWQGDLSPVPLIGLHRRGEAPRLPLADQPLAMKGYAGSIAFSQDGAQVAITSPRGGLAHVFDAETATFSGTLEAADICGLARGAEGFLATTGHGEIIGFDGKVVRWQNAHAGAWDNHLIAVG